MTDPRQHDPLDALGEAYERMFERAAEHFHRAEEKTAPVLRKLIDEAREQAVELKEISREDAEKVAEWLKRDLHHAAEVLSETGRELEDWLGFEASLVKSNLVDLMLKAADKTQLELLKFRQEISGEPVWRTGEITGPGTLRCRKCGEKLHFHHTGRIPPCPRCHGTEFMR
ncbi:MAG TPA: hypothetical protein ENJ79_05240 [Gammaproteobacteria bacterium]|nr:hypothetical protein [Gammaproteobacteria bacterium]